MRKSKKLLDVCFGESAALSERMISNSLASTSGAGIGKTSSCLLSLLLTLMQLSFQHFATSVVRCNLKGPFGGVSHANRLPSSSFFVLSQLLVLP